MNNKILIVDDDLFLLDMYVLKFKESGFNVEMATNGNDAINKLKDMVEEPDAVLLDVLMPVMDGFELLKHIKDKGLVQKSKKIILSNLGQKEEINMGLSLGADDYIIKAHNTPSEVVEKVKQLLAS